MEENIYVLDMPDFKPVYEQNLEYGYHGKRGERLKQLLLDTSDYHCMYCFASLKGDRTDLGEIEHSVEKTLSGYLVECVPNMAVTCEDCNQSLKRSGEKQRKDKIAPYIEEFEKDLNCQGTKCKAFCKAYARLRNQYCKLNKIVLQPFSVKSDISGMEYRLQYDVMNAEFIPSKRYGYNDKDMEVMEYHIRQFRLNDINYKTRALMEFIEDTIEADGKYSKQKNRYSNYIVDLFIEKIRNYPPEKVLRICEKIYINYQLQHITKN